MADNKYRQLCIWACTLLSSINLAQIAVAAEITVEAETKSADVIARIHFNTQTADFATTREFYRLLGYTEGQSNYPKTNTYQMARSLGMYDLCTYKIEQIEVMRIPDAIGPTSIDLIQFAVPYNDEPPYSQPNHLGMAYAALQTTNLAHDHAYLTKQGVNFLSEPYGAPGNQFVFFQDPDGVWLKLVETDEPQTTNNKGTNIVSMPYVGINVSDLDTALAFYKSLGYTNVNPLQAPEDLAEARAYGFNKPIRFKGADIALPAGDQHQLRIIQWLDPFNDEPPYPAPISHIGIHRIALAVTNLDQAVGMLSEQGVEFLSDVAPCCSGTGDDEIGIINALDPDGTFVELVGPITKRPLKPLPADCK